MFRIKICGITSVDDALAAARTGADAIGLNFYRRSPRYIEPQTAVEIIRALPNRVVRVGLFVDSPSEEVCRSFDDLKLDFIQLHGDQPPEFLAQLGGRPVMRAFRVGPDGLGPRDCPNFRAGENGTVPFIAGITVYLDRCRCLAALPALTLLDSLVAGQYGGTGQVVDWGIAKAYQAAAGVPPLVLAGGLTPQNVAAAIRTVRPAAVDVASGVESSPGRKDHAAIAAFVQAARAAFGNS